MAGVNCQRRSNCQGCPSSAQSWVWFWLSYARTCHQYWSLFRVTAGDQRVATDVDWATTLVKLSSVLTRTSYLLAPGTRVHSSTTSWTTAFAAGPTRVGWASGSTSYDRVPDHSVAWPLPSTARTFQW